MRSRVRSVGLVMGATATALVVGCVPAVGVPRGAGGVTVAASTSRGVSPDFDGDGRADLVHGVGATQGEVFVRYGSGATARFGRATDEGPAASQYSSYGFGQGLLARDLNRDGFTDLVVVDQSPAAAAIQFVLGSPSGLQVAGAHRYPAPPSVSAVLGTPALVESPTPLLVVRAAAPASVARGGAILAYPLGPDGLPAIAPSVLSQRNLPGTDETGDAFGASLAASGSLLLVGAPGEDVGRVKDAGAVTALRYLGGGIRFTGTLWTQNSKGVAGAAEKGDRFGTSVAIGDGRAAVGVPFEDGARHDSGAVAVFRASATKLTPLRTITQSTKGVPGISEVDDRFGWSVAVLRACPGVTGVLVGAPNETMGSMAQAGSAWVIPLRTTCPARQLAEGGRLGGAAAEMALVGAAVTALRTDATAADTIVVTAPGVSEEGVLGRVLTVAADGSVTTAAADLQLHEEGTIAVSPPAY